MALPASPRSLTMSAVRAVRIVGAWPVASQQKARRNAMLACTSLTQRRMERQDVEDFLHSFYGTSGTSALSTGTSTGTSTAAKAVAHG
jgi:hypothetical protein